MSKSKEPDYDFGFSFSDESELAAPVRTSAVEEYKSKLKEVEDLVLPLLNNLKKNPDKPYIKWENRVPVIDAQIEKIIAITRS
jgi:hypothetical protein